LPAPRVCDFTRTLFGGAHFTAQNGRSW
jgi:hypothetical protein